MMKMSTKILYISAITAGSFAGCVKPYIPSTTTTNANILVVEGLINTSDSTIIKLSRTVIIANKTTVSPETKAVITIENAQATVSALTETVKGTYVTPALKLDITKQYRLRIKTSNGKVYLSDLADAKVAPPIDSIGYKTSTTGMQVYVNAHDPNNSTHYYKYDYRETWMFSSYYNAFYTGDGKSDITARTQAQMVDKCFGTDTSANTTLNSTISLSQDVVYQFPITTVDASSEKIETKYSILVSQQALTKDAYTFWTNLKKNTEQLGSIFDALPSQLIGNIHNINDGSEPVIGYISVGTIQKKRVFITKAQLPQTWVLQYPYVCLLDSAYYVNPQTKRNDIIDGMLYVFGTDEVSPFAVPSKGWLYTDAQCADCTIRGTKQQPSYWK